MWFPVRIQVQDFFSFEDEVYTFKRALADFVCGENLYDDGQESNGSGKSVLVGEAVFFAITGDTLRDVNASDIIRIGCTRSSVLFSMENAMTGDRCTVSRVLERGKSSKAELYINDEPVKGLVNVDGVKNRLFQMLDITREDLLNFYIVSKERYASFFSFSDTKIKDVIRRFSGTAKLDNIDALIEVDIKEQDGKIRKVEDLMVGIKSKMEVLEESLLSDRKKLFEEDKKDKIAKLQQRFAENQRQQTMNEEAETHLVKELDGLVPMEDSVFTELEEKLKKLRDSEPAKKQELQDARKELSELESLMADIDKVLAEKVVCPKCQHEFSFRDGELDMAQFVEAKVSTGEDIAAAKVTVTDAKKVADDIFRDIDEQKRKLSDLRDKNTKIGDRRRTLQSKINDSKNAHVSLVSASGILSDQMSTLEETEFVDDSADIRKKIANLQEQMDEAREELDEEKSTKDSLMLSMMNYRLFKTHLANKSIKVIESMMNEYLVQMGSNLAVRLEGYRVMGDNTIRDKITATVMRNGIEEGSIRRFSGGEKARIDIASILCFRKLFNMSSRSGGLDLMSLDEIVESVDSRGLDSIMTSLSGLNETIQVITHATSTRNYNTVTTVQKGRDGVSRIKNSNT